MNKKILSLLVLGLLIISGIVGNLQAIAKDDSANTGQAVYKAVANEAEKDNYKDVDEKFEKPDKPITGTALEKASQAALNYLGQGKVTETEIEDEESYYEIEVKLDNGREVDVQLDKSFKVVGTETD